jgi:Zn finger protein HypA/HybF involved in hydrogenase expression
MHELAVCVAIAETVRDRAKGRNPDSVRSGSATCARWCLIPWCSAGRW